MAAEDFFSRWAARKTGAGHQPAAVAPPVPAAPVSDRAIPDRPGVAGTPPAPPTLADVDNLTQDSDYSAFLADGVDDTVRRSAMKKLFTDPHFNIMDGLDIYIGDYSQPDPIPAAMLAALNHGRALLDPLSQFEKPLMNLINPARTDAQPVPVPVDDGADEGAQDAARPDEPALANEAASPLPEDAASASEPDPAPHRQGEQSVPETDIATATPTSNPNQADS